MAFLSLFLLPHHPPSLQYTYTLAHQMILLKSKTVARRKSSLKPWASRLSFRSPNHALIKSHSHDKTHFQVFFKKATSLRYKSVQYISFKYCAELCNHHQNQFWNIFISKKENLDSLIFTSFFLPNSLALGNYLLFYFFSQ